jgi:hypothetical protein
MPLHYSVAILERKATSAARLPGLAFARTTRSEISTGVLAQSEEEICTRPRNGFEENEGRSANEPETFAATHRKGIEGMPGLG